MTPQFVTFSYMASMFGDLPVVGFVIATFAMAYFVVWYAVRPPMRTGNYYGEWWVASLSSDRFTPKNESEEYAYAAGLRDSLRIVRQMGVTTPQREYCEALHNRAKLFEDDGSGTVNSKHQRPGKFLNRRIPK